MADHTSVHENHQDGAVHENSQEAAVPENRPGTSVPDNRPDTSVPDNRPDTSVPENRPDAAVPENRQDAAVPKNRLDFGKLDYGCEHYRRRCKILAPCCNRVFTCRHCHNETVSSLSDPKERHEIVRHDVQRVICAVCDTEQPVAKVCSKCGVNMGEYFCEVCRFYDDETQKNQFHCDDCGICRVGGRDNFFHCPKCGSCFKTTLLNNHTCVQDSMKSCCPICCEYLFDSVKETTIIQCGHTIHFDCYKEMLEQNQYRCPVCSKSSMDMSLQWQRLEIEKQGHYNKAQASGGVFGRMGTYDFLRAKSFLSKRPNFVSLRMMYTWRLVIHCKQHLNLPSFMDSIMYDSSRA